MQLRALRNERAQEEEAQEKETMNEGKKWETARHDAWLRELLTDSSENEPTDVYSRFAESGRWAGEMTGNRDNECCEREESMEMESQVQATMTSQGECSGP